MVDTALFLVLAVSATVLAAAAIRRWPAGGLVVWLVVLAFVPIWVAAPVQFVTYPASQVGALVLVALLPFRRVRLGLPDLFAGMFLVACVAPVFVGGASLTTVAVVVAQWGIAFLVGRLLPCRVDLHWIYGAVAAVFTVVSILAIVEFILGWNPFVGLGPASPLHLAWQELQLRGGVVRAEGAFGHSIALGSSIALVIPLTLVSRFRVSVRISMVLLMLAAVAITVSRVSILGAVLATALVLVFVKRGVTRRLRAGMVGVLLAGGVAAIPWILSVLDSAGQEAAGSADYRADLTSLIPSFSPLGISPVANRSADGTLFFGRFRSVDSQLILTGLTYGWLAAVVAGVALICAVIAVLRLRASVGTVAVVAQVPALATVALITQYALVFWFLAGLAAAGQVAQNLTSSGDSPDDPWSGNTDASEVTTEAHPVSTLASMRTAAPRRRSEGQWV